MTIYRDDLERVYALLEDPKRWTQKRWARSSDNDGDQVNPNDPSADCWCLEGAFCKVMGFPPIDPDRPSKNSKFCEVGDALGFGGMAVAAEFNDSHTHPEVLALLRAAIERAPVRPS